MALDCFWISVLGLDELFSLESINLVGIQITLSIPQTDESHLRVQLID